MGRLARAAEVELKRIGRFIDSDGYYRDGEVVRLPAIEHMLSLDPREYGWLWDDFADTNGILTATTNGIGAAVTSSAAIAGRLGLLDLDTGTTTSGYAAVAGGVDQLLLGSGAVRFVSSLNLDTLSAVGERFQLSSGLQDDVTALCNNGVHFQYQDNLSSGVLRCRTVSGGTATTSDTSITVAKATWYTLEILVNADATEAVFFVNGNAEGAITTNIPTANDLGVVACNIRKASGTTARSALVDYCGLRVDFSTPR